MNSLSKTHSKTKESVSQKNHPPLSWWSSGLILVAVLCIFVLYNPIWHKLDIAAWEENILYSYYPIPLLVLLALWIERKRSLINLCLESLKIGLLKFGITYAITHAIWITSGFPEPARLPANRPRPKGQAQLIAAASIPTSGKGDINGIALDTMGQPISHAFIYISKGLENYSFDKVEPPLNLKHDGSGFSKQIFPIQMPQPLIIHSQDDELHTMAVYDSKGKLVLNYPLIASKKRTIDFEACHGIVQLKCTVHTKKESPLNLAVLCNPFATFTNNKGEFTFKQVPVGQLQVTLWTPSQHHATQSLELNTGASHHLVLSIQ